MERTPIYTANLLLIGIFESTLFCEIGINPADSPDLVDAISASILSCIAIWYEENGVEFNFSEDYVNPDAVVNAVENTKLALAFAAVEVLASQQSEM